MNENKRVAMWGAWLEERARCLALAVMAAWAGVLHVLDCQEMALGANLVVLVLFMGPFAVRYVVRPGWTGLVRPGWRTLGHARSRWAAVRWQRAQARTPFPSAGAYR